MNRYVNVGEVFGKTLWKDDEGDFLLGGYLNDDGEVEGNAVWLTCSSRSRALAASCCDVLKALMTAATADTVPTPPPPAPKAKTGLIVFDKYQSYHYPTAFYYDVDANGTLALFKTDIEEDVVVVFAPGNWLRVENVSNTSEVK